MAAGGLMWVGLLCCLGALWVKLFPEPAFAAGADPSAAWLVFVFGVFLMVLSSYVTVAIGRRARTCEHFTDTH
ncbi:MAG: hypothetical protein AAGA09_02925 [Pseudomonadota bacterium]